MRQEDRWRENHAVRKHNHSKAYYIELGGYLTRGEAKFWGMDIEISGTGEPAAREKLGRHIRDALASSFGKRERVDDEKRDDSTRLGARRET